jgi:hypothetical protein
VRPLGPVDDMNSTAFLSDDVGQEGWKGERENKAQDAARN